ncbi:MAG: DNA internalization-related competence protein ComEC/Rec2 [Oscillospiraceae bacterium]
MIRRLATFALSFAAGIFLAQYLAPLRWQPLLAAAFALLALTGLLQKEKKRRMRLLLMGFGLAFAFCWNYAYTALVQLPAQALAGQTLESAEVTVLDYAEERSADGWGLQSKYRVRVRLESGTGRHNACLYAGEELLALEPGNRLRATMAVTDASRVGDEEIASFTSRNIFLLLFPRGGLETEPGDAGSLRYLPQRLARRVQEEIAALYEGDAAALVQALLTGDKSGFGDETSTALSEAGLLHIAAVSGLHCMFLLSLVQLLLGRRRRFAVAAVGVPLLLLYALMVGATPSVLRAVVMLLFLLLAPLLGRESDRLTAFSAALMLLLLLNPFAAASVSLQLSFAAAAGILWLTPKLYRFLCAAPLKGRLWRSFSATVSATFGALVFTAPLSAWYFNILVLVSPLSNLLCLWAVSVLFALALLSLALGLVCPPAAVIAAFPAKWLAAYILFVCRGLSRLPYHAVYFDSPYIACWLGFAYLLLGFCCLLRGGRRQNLLAVLSGVLTLLLCIGLTRLDCRYGELNIVALDVGQGQSIAVTSGSAAALIDCGSSNSYLSAGDIAGDALLSAGAYTLDYLVLTHYHTDHTDGLPVLFSRLEVEKLLAPEPKEGDEVAAAVLRLAERYGTEVVFITEDASYPLGAATLRLLAPVEGLSQEDENENGLAVLCSAGDFDFLVTGDMSAETELALLGQKQLPDLEVLMVGHHGSKYSSGETFLDAVDAETGIISVGDNSYGHPTEEALERLAEQGMEVYRTDLQGDVRISVR